MEVLISHHVPEFAFGDNFYRFHSEAGAKDSIEGRRCASALKVTEHAGAGFFSGPPRDLVGDNFADTAKRIFTRSSLTNRLASTHCASTFRDHHERAQTTFG